MTEPQTLSGKRLEHLMDMELEHRQGMRRATDGKGRLGDYLTSGEGAVFGPRINGIVHWDLFVKDNPFLRPASLSGRIKTDDGVIITFESLGFQMQADRLQAMRWAVTAAVRFETEDRAFTWLNTSLCLWHGVFDLGALRHSYRVFVQVDG